jgi:hypothetical protein
LSFRFDITKMKKDLSSFLFVVLDRISRTTQWTRSNFVVKSSAY